MKSYRMMSNPILPLACAAALLLVVGCKSADAMTDTSLPTAATEQAEPVADDAEKKAPNFKIAVTSPALTVGGKGTASVSVAALNGYKWNKEYPAKLIFKTPPKNVKLGKTEFKQLAGDFKIGDKKTDIPVGMMANAAGAESFKGALKFSICNATACIIEKAEVTLAVKVQP